MSDDFYIGYEQTMPERIAARVRAAVVVLLAVSVATSAIAVLTQQRFSAATFEFGRTRTFEGVLVEHPYPALLVRTHLEADARPDTYWLVGAGKHGAGDIVRGLDGRVAQISGTLIEREGDRMIEVSSARALTERAASGIPPLEKIHSLGSVTLRGEVVDSKCHLGVMKPGEGPTHRDCAVRCLLGRITPMFVAQGDRDRVGRLALVDADGGPFGEAVDALVGRPVEVRGELLVRGPMRFLAVQSTIVEASFERAAPAKARLYENGASFLNVASTQR